MFYLTLKGLPFTVISEVGGEGRRRGRCHELVHCPNAHNSPVWAQLMPQARSSIRVSCHVSGRIIAAGFRGVHKPEAAAKAPTQAFQGGMQASEPVSSPLGRSNTHLTTARVTPGRF